MADMTLLPTMPASHLSSISERGMSPTKPGSRLLWTFVLACCASTGVHATTFCVSTPTELRNALTSSNSNGVDDEIRVRSGIYAPASGNAQSGQYYLIMTGDQNLLITGGWSGAAGVCTTQTQNAGLTLFDGNGTARVFDFGLNGTANSLVIRNLSIYNGRSNDGLGGCMRVQTYLNTGANVEIERTRMYGCYAGAQGGALALLMQWGQGHIHGNVFSSNESATQGAVFLSGNAQAHGVNISFQNNTVVGNTRTNGSGFGSAGLEIVCRPDWACYVANNIFFDNEDGGGAADLRIVGSVSLKNNRYTTLSGAPSSNTAPTHANPGFLSANDFRLRNDSPMRNAGTTDLFYGFPTLDVDGGARPQGGAIDIGAIEFPELFASNFE
jgi:hypothetical protein